MGAKAELDTFQKTLWCLSCYCCYTGYSYDINPICAQDGKLCCCYINVETAYCCSDDGCIEADCKCCGIVLDGSIPAGYSPGCVIVVELFAAATCQTTQRGQRLSKSKCCRS